MYVEKEDEFDVVVDSLDPEGHKRQAEKEQQEEEAIVSIEAIDTVSLKDHVSLPFPSIFRRSYVLRSASASHLMSCGQRWHP